MVCQAVDVRQAWQRVGWQGRAILPLLHFSVPVGPLLRPAVGFELVGLAAMSGGPILLVPGASCVRMTR